MTPPKNRIALAQSVLSIVNNVTLCALVFKALMTDRQSFSSPPKKFRDKCASAISVLSLDGIEGCLLILQDDLAIYHYSHFLQIVGIDEGTRLVFMNTFALECRLIGPVPTLMMFNLSHVNVIDRVPWLQSQHVIVSIVIFPFDTIILALFSFEPELSVYVIWHDLD
jgi:hypothetical protein